MTTLIFTACLISAPLDCERYAMTADVSPLACVMGAPAELATWAAEHPDRRVVRWECRG